MNNSSAVLICPLCRHHFTGATAKDATSIRVFGYGLDFRHLPLDCNLSHEIALCPNCLFAFLLRDPETRVPGSAKDLVRSAKYKSIFQDAPEENLLSRSWIGLTALMKAQGRNPREVGMTGLKGAWCAREQNDPTTEDELLGIADYHLDQALRRGLAKGDPGLIMYLLGEISRRRGEFLRGREMLTFLGNNPRYRYPALLLTVLIEEEDSTPYWSLHAPDAMELHSPKFKGLFPPLRSIPPGKREFSSDELTDTTGQQDEDDSHTF